MGRNRYPYNSPRTIDCKLSYIQAFYSAGERIKYVFMARDFLRSFAFVLKNNERKTT